MKVQNTVSGIVKKYLETCGTKTDDINRMVGETSLYHDLKIYGDIAESYMDELAGNHGVDMSQFHFNDYFPEEFSGDTLFKKYLYTFIPFLRKKYSNSQKFKPLTMNMIDVAIRTGRFTEPMGSYTIDIKK